MTPFSFSSSAINNGFIKTISSGSGTAQGAVQATLSDVQNNFPQHIILFMQVIENNTSFPGYECVITFVDLAISGSENTVQVYSETQSKSK